MPGKDDKSAVVTKPTKKLTPVELERIASRQRAHEQKVRTFLVGR